MDYQSVEIGRFNVELPRFIDQVAKKELSKKNAQFIRDLVRDMMLPGGCKKIYVRERQSGSTTGAIIAASLVGMYTGRSTYFLIEKEGNLQKVHDLHYRFLNRKEPKFNKDRFPTNSLLSNDSWYGITALNIGITFIYQQLMNTGSIIITDNVGSSIHKAMKEFSQYNGTVIHIESQEISNTIV